MPFNALGFVLASALTRDMADRARAAQISLLGGLVGSSPAGVVLLAAVAGTGDRGVGRVAGAAPAAGGPTRVQVPELPDDQEGAEKILKSRGLVPLTSTVASDEPIDNVIGSDPPAETIVRRGSTVAVLVSAGVEVPDVTNKKAEDAESILRDAGFETERRRSEKSGHEDRVEHQDPEGGTFADAGATVTLYVFEPKARMLRATPDEDE
jgi:beta-lactam-binding protein with PASTA domain